MLRHAHRRDKAREAVINAGCCISMQSIDYYQYMYIVFPILPPTFVLPPINTQLHRYCTTTFVLNPPLAVLIRRRRDSFSPNIPIHRYMWCYWIMALFSFNQAEVFLCFDEGSGGEWRNLVFVCEMDSHFVH